MPITTYVIVFGVVVVVLLLKMFLVDKPAQKKSLAKLAGVPKEELSYIFMGKHTSIRSVDGEAPAIDPSKKKDGQVCVVVRAGMRQLNVGFYKAAVVGPNKYNNSSLSYNFEPGRSYRLYIVMPDRKSVDYRISLIPNA